MFVRGLGNGSRTVLLLHGAPSPADDLLPLASSLADQYRVLLPDLPGYGKTPGGDLSYETTNRRLVAMLREQDAMQLHAVIGFSGGVLRALYLLLRGGVESAHLVSLSGLAGCNTVEREGFRGSARFVRDGGEDALRSPAMISLMGERMLSARWRAAHPEDVQRVGGWLRLLSAADLASELDASADTEDFRPELGRLRSRVHARVGALDAATPPEKSTAFSVVPDSDVTVVADVGHALLIEDGPATIAWVLGATAELHAG